MNHVMTWKEIWPFFWGERKKNLFYSTRCFNYSLSSHYRHFDLAKTNSRLLKLNCTTFHLGLNGEKLWSQTSLNRWRGVFNYTTLDVGVLWATKKTKQETISTFFRMRLLLFFLLRLQLQFQVSSFLTAMQVPSCSSNESFSALLSRFNFCLRSRHAEQFSLSKCFEILAI